MSKIQRVLISVTDKTGILDFARGLSALGAEIVSTGGTARMMREAGIAVRDVSEVTGFPEMLDGRVKTLHPKIAGGMLAIRGRADHMQALEQHGIAPIDMVVVNLYRFEDVAAKAGATLEELIENIDIGGPTMIRAAAKNYQDVAVVVSPVDYPAILDGTAGECRRTLAGDEMAPGPQGVSHHRRLRCRHQRAAGAGGCARRSFAAGVESARAQSDGPALRRESAPVGGTVWQGRQGHRRRRTASRQGAFLQQPGGPGRGLATGLRIPAPAVAIIKHTNPCGCAEQETLAEAYRQALECDPVSAYGGVIGVNRAVDEETAREIAKTFVEAIAAPDYAPEALAILKTRRNLRVMQVEAAADLLVVKSISGGFLAQTADSAALDRATRW